MLRSAKKCENHPLYPIFEKVVRIQFRNIPELCDEDMIKHATSLLCNFSEVDSFYQIRDAEGHPIEELDAMIRAADPVNGPARSFNAERSMRKYIGDFALFVSGMCPQDLETNEYCRRPSLSELIRAGKESYFIVSQFNLFEYEEEAPFFARLSEQFDDCKHGLRLVSQSLPKTERSFLLGNKGLL